VLLLLLLLLLLLRGSLSLSLSLCAESAPAMGVDGAKCKMLVERVLKETFPKAMAYNKQKVAEWAQTVLSGACEKLKAMEESDIKFIREPARPAAARTHARARGSRPCMCPLPVCLAACTWSRPR
jgi:hypothetical protein